jgi:chromosome partitioning protein
MKAIAVVSQKGGAGKTTLALHIAVAAELAGLSAAILDMDPQGTAERWGEWRKEEPPAVVAAKTTTLARRLEQARAAEGDLVVIDTPPLAQAEAREAARAADLILIPCRPSAFDLDAIRITADLANDIRRPAFVVVNAGPPHGTAVYKDVEEVVERFGLRLAPTRLAERAAFRHAVRDGKSAQELEPGSKAAEEVSALWDWIAGHLGIRESRKQVIPSVASS